MKTKNNCCKNNSSLCLNHFLCSPCRSELTSYFVKSKVNSCKKVVYLRNGSSLAISYKFPIPPIKKNKNLSLSNSYCEKYDENSIMKSTYMNDFIQRQNMHLGMNKKPLIPYSPFCQRSRLPLKDFIYNPQRETKSFIELPKINAKKRWISTNKDCYRYPIQLHISNNGITSEMAKRMRSLMGY